MSMSQTTRYFFPALDVYVVPLPPGQMVDAVLLGLNVDEEVAALRNPPSWKDW